MLEAILCSLLLICGGPSPSAYNGGLPSYEQTASYAVPIIQRWEGTGPQVACGRSASGVCYQAYLDTIAEPDVPTIGHGQTLLFRSDGSLDRPVRMGDVLTAEEAHRQFSIGLRVQYWMPYRDCLTADSVAPQTDGAFLSLTWNIGRGAVCGSTALRRLNAGDIRGACEALTWWNRAGGRVVRGLVNRRADEHRLCLEGAA
ncbi:glycoside hydrolase family protein [Rhodobacterales bacterium HKCCE4037]|nr:glycoside hydrolase family protein [Rhodobacterales bacterium HKCCE4037]